MVPELTRCQADKDSVFGREGEHLQTGGGGGGVLGIGICSLEM